MERKQVIKDIEELNRSLNEELLRLPSAYLDYHKIAPGSIPPNLLNESEKIMYSVGNKIECIIFHMRVLLQVEQQIFKGFQSDPFDVEKQNDLLIYGGNNLLFFLDDIVIHIVSLFDYLGNLIGFCFHGDDKKYLKWKGIISYCESRDRERNDCEVEKIKNSLVCPVALKYQKELLSKLEPYRGNRIHLMKDSAERIVSLNLMDPANSKIEFGVPTELKTWAKKNFPQAESLIDISICFVKKSLFGANEILSKLRQAMKQEK